MNKTDDRVARLLADADDWGPGGARGNEEAFAAAAPADETAKVNDLIGMQMISIRLQRDLLRDLKAIAEHHGLGYQPMIRDLLTGFARSEIRQILSERLKDLDEAPASESTAPVEEFLRKRA